MRFRAIASACLLLAVSAGGVKTMAASPDCARWIKDYQQGLAKRAVIAKRHVVHAAYHVTVPRPKPVHTGPPIHTFRPPRLTPAEMLKRFKVLCGEDLPSDTLPVSFAPTNLEASLLPMAPADAGPVADSGQPFIPPAVGVTPLSPAITTPGGGGGGGIGGFPGLPVSPGSSTPGTPNTPGTPSGPGTPDVPVTPTEPVVPSQVPEPSSILLLATGALTGLPLILRRRR